MSRAAPPKGNCGGCNQPVSGKVITALGRPWHLEHFVCSSCREAIGTQRFFEREKMPFCGKCHTDMFAPKCSGCNQAITGKCLTAMDKPWHPEHFVCTKCKRPFDDKTGFHEQGGVPFCPNCYYDSFSSKCAGCSQMITDAYVTAMNLQWHPNCFVCQDCRKDFDGGSFLELEGRPLCEVCYHKKMGTLCPSCDQPISGRCVNANGRNFHPEHFVCYLCKNDLNIGGFQEHMEKPYCDGCIGKVSGSSM